MKIPFYQVDAFTAHAFGGNPAAVCLLDEWLSDDMLQAIAAENNLSETAYLVKQEGGYQLRWFTPTVEIDLCGHATLASGHVVFSALEPALSSVRFFTQSGELTVTRDGQRLCLAMPAAAISGQTDDAQLVDALGAQPLELWQANYAVAVYAGAAQIAALQPDFSRLAQCGARAVAVTAPGVDCDFVSRFFAPRLGINEDPVTGGAHCLLVPFWAQRLGKTQLYARQLSARGGELWCRLDGGKVELAGHCVQVIRGELML